MSQGKEPQTFEELFERYFSNYTATSNGYAWHPLKCEYCGCEFMFKQHIATTTPLFHRYTEADAIAEAEKVFQHEAEQGKRKVRIVSCPECGNFSPS